MADHGQSFSVKNLQRMIQFAEVFADEKDCRITDTTIELENSGLQIVTGCNKKSKINRGHAK